VSEQPEREADGVITGSDLWGDHGWLWLAPLPSGSPALPLPPPQDVDPIIRLQSISCTPFDFNSNRNVKNVAHFHITQLYPPPIRCSPLHRWECLPCRAHRVIGRPQSQITIPVRRKGSPISHRGYRPAILLIILFHPSDPLSAPSVLLPSHHLAHHRATCCPTFYQTTSPRARQPHAL
jgi:hypothetical protein